MNEVTTAATRADHEQGGLSPTFFEHDASPVDELSPSQTDPNVSSEETQTQPSFSTSSSSSDSFSSASCASDASTVPVDGLCAPDHHTAKYAFFLTFDFLSLHHPLDCLSVSTVFPVSSCESLQAFSRSFWSPLFPYPLSFAVVAVVLFMRVTSSLAACSVVLLLISSSVRVSALALLVILGDLSQEAMIIQVDSLCAIRCHLPLQITIAMLHKRNQKKKSLPLTSWN